MKICILGENGSTHVQKWIRGILSESDHEIHIITFNRGILDERAHYHFLKQHVNNKLDYILNCGLVKKYINRIKPDILHAHYATSYGLLGALSNFHPYLITGWGADIFDSPKNFLMKQMVQYSFRQADGLTVLTKFTQDELKKLTTKPATLVPFGVNTNFFKPGEHKEKNKLHIGTIRTLAPKYGVEFLIRAFALLAAKFPHIHLDIVGHGEQYEQFVLLTKELNIHERVTFFGFVNQHAEPEKYISILQNMDIFTILSVLDSETFGVAAVEAMACGIPVVASDIGGLPEVLNKEAGLLAKPGDTLSIAAALESLITNADLRQTLGKNGRARATSTYNWQNNIRSMLAVYEVLITKK